MDDEHPLDRAIAELRGEVAYATGGRPPGWWQSGAWREFMETTRSQIRAIRVLERQRSTDWWWG